jgi:hypothetical protein
MTACARRSVQDKEQLMLMPMVMPDEVADQFHELHVLPVQLTDDPGSTAP